MPKKKLSKPEDYEQLGRMIEHVYETAYISRFRMYKMSFVKGIVAGFGGVLGATIVVGLLLAILSLFDRVPLIGPFTQKIQDTVEIQKTP